MFKHLLATRFNVRIGDWKTTKNGEVLLTDKWMEDRFTLFESYCFPSVINQSNQNFTWCIYFDIETNEIFKQRIKKLTESYPNIRIFFIDGIIELRPHLIDFIASMSEDDFSYVITSRLDNDDLLHRDYIKVIQNLFEPLHNTLIDLRSGYQVSIENQECEIRNYTNSFNPFISLIENKKSIGTVFSQMHKDRVKSENVIIYDQSKLWIELVHPKNKINAVNSNLEFALKFNAAEFGIPGKLILRKSIKYYLYFLNKILDNLLFFTKRNIKKRLAFILGK